MEGLSSRKTASGLYFSRKESGLVLKDTSTDRGRSTPPSPICSKVGCSSKMSSIQDTRTGPDKAKTIKRPLYLPRNGKESTGSSSRTPAAPALRKLSSEPRKKLPFQEPSTLREETEALGRVIGQHSARDRLTSRAQTNVSRESTSTELCSRHGKAAIRNGDRNSKTEASSSKYNLKNLKCNVLNDVDPSSSTSIPSSSESILGRKKPSGRKRIVETESSLPTRGKRISGLQIDERRNNDSHQGICISDSRRRNLSSTRNDTVTSLITGRSTGRARRNEQENQSRIQQRESSSLMPLFPRSGIALDTNAYISEYEFPSRRSNLISRLGNSSLNMPSNASLAGRSSTSREDARHHNLDGIAEMLLALDRIDQDDDLTYEQLLVLETNFFLRGLAYHDQHRDMRLDIDNMSYEQLLELEERMGSVSTALSEEALAKCLRKSIYEAQTDGLNGIAEDGDNDIKCSICQEEYKDGNEVGRLECDHKYHVECIERWLQLKNWCPICKASVEPSSSNS